MIATGTSPDDSLVEIMELKGHKWFLGCQFHPELRSRPLDCHPLFRGLIHAALARRGRNRAGALQSPRVEVGFVTVAEFASGEVRFGGPRLVLIAGPCVIESRDACCAMPTIGRNRAQSRGPAGIQILFR